MEKPIIFFHPKGDLKKIKRHPAPGHPSDPKPLYHACHKNDHQQNTFYGDVYLKKHICTYVYIYIYSKIDHIYHKYKHISPGPVFSPTENSTPSPKPLHFAQLSRYLTSIPVSFGLNRLDRLVGWIERRRAWVTWDLRFWLYVIILQTKRNDIHIHITYCNIMIAVWWFRNPKQPLGMYKTLYIMGYFTCLTCAGFLPSTVWHMIFLFYNRKKLGT